MLILKIEYYLFKVKKKEGFKIILDKCKELIEGLMKMKEIFW